MPSKPRPKASRKARGEAAIRTGITADDVFNDLLDMYAEAEGEKRWEYGIALLPYMKPKLKAVDLTTTDFDGTIVIGGEETYLPPEAPQIDHNLETSPASH